MAATFSDPISTFLNTYDRLSRPAAAVASRFDVDNVEANVLAIAKAIEINPDVEPPVSSVIDATNLSKSSFLAAMAAGKNLGLFVAAGEDGAKLRLTSLGREFVADKIIGN